MNRGRHLRAAEEEEEEEEEEEKLMDDYLASVGLHRKRVAKDGSCLFRAVAEQVHLSQNLHKEVRAQCVRFLRQHRESYAAFIEGDFEAYLERLHDPQQWAGEVEMNALAIMYKRDFVIFQEPGRPPVDITGNKFKEKVQLSFLHGNHYDCVYPVSRIKNAALCQSVLYELLYADVFRVSRRALASCRGSGRACERLSDDNMAACASGDESDPDAGNDFRGENSRSRGALLPESVRRSLSASLYRNVAYDTWQKAKKAQQKRDYCMAAGLQYTVGQRCQVRLDGSEQSYDGTIEEISPSGGPVTVYTDEEGTILVPLWSLRPATSDGSSWSAVLRRERRISSGQRESAPKSFSGPRAPSAGGHQQKSRPPQGELRRSRKSARETASFDLSVEEFQLKDEHSFPPLGRSCPNEDAAGEQKSLTGPLQHTAACPSSPPSTDAAALSSNTGPAPTFISPIAPSPGAAAAAARSLSSPSPPADPRSSSSSPAQPLSRLPEALGLSVPGPTQSPDAGEAGSAPTGQEAAEELKAQPADATDPPRGQNQSWTAPSPFIRTTPQNPSENESAQRPLPVSSSDIPQPSGAAPVPLGYLPTLPGGVPVRHLAQDPLYPGFPLGESGNVLPPPDFSLCKSGEDLPRDVNILRFFFNLGVKAYNWPLYMPYMYLLPLQQAHIMHPHILSPVPSHRPPDGPPRPTCSPTQSSDSADAWPAPHDPAYCACPWQQHPAAGPAGRNPPAAVLPSHPWEPNVDVHHRGSLQAFPINSPLASKMGDEAVAVIPPLDINQRPGRAVPLARIPAGGHTPPPHRPSVGCNTDEGDESSRLTAAPRRHYGGRRGYRRRRGSQPGTYGGY
ncbi:OTU domain-containing protein 4 isoform X2 [Syngnathoides biaculeatus]|uniref:OTU domain-containing protein 4 isoform X2 n=1 Tax=Syngnathoides biaculeatus TaxID=300417 RepID=UPI002ADE23F1|nr:OTU domain-containing protein 4 isoform X2 [Syngnathoides biaculeatus]